MAYCERYTTSNTNTTNNTTHITRTINRIIELQREANVENTCESCEGSLVSHIYNTKPVTFYLRGGNPYTVTVPGLNAITSDLFRIESVNNDAVVLRILYNDNGNTVCTNYTAILNMGCICGMQCFDPICCEECTRGCGVQ